MGSPVSAIVADLYMEHFEELALRSALQQPRFWKKYVNDTCCVVKSGTVQELHQHLNIIWPSIQFTVEVEQEGTLPFLDTYLCWMEDGSLDITVCRKSTHTIRYLHFNSHHPRHVKQGLVQCLYSRAERITQTTQNLAKERKHLRKILNTNGHPNRFISKAMTIQACKVPDWTPKLPSSSHI